MHSHSRKALALALCLLLFTIGTALLYASGQAEPRLAQVQKMIDAQDYTGALKMLVDIQRQDPSLRDKANQLMQKVMAVMQEYNVILEQLNKAIEAGDAKRIEALITQLQRTDPAQAAGLLSQARAVTGFLRMMNDAQALLAAGKPLEALARYQLAFTDPKRAGFSLPREEFDSAGYGQILVSTVRSSIAEVLAAVGQGTTAQPGIARVLPSVMTLLAQGASADTIAELDSITAPLLKAAAAEGAVKKGAAAILDVNRTIQQTSDKGRDDPYLRYVLWICLGRGNKPEGIAYAIRELWVDAARAAAAASSQSVQEAFNSARARFESGSLAQADREMQAVPTRSLIAVKLGALALATFQVGPDDGWTIPAADAKQAGSFLDDALVAQEDSSEASAYRLLISFRADLETLPSVAVNGPLPAPVAAGPELAGLASDRAALDAHAVQARAQEAAWTSQAALWDSKTDVAGAARTIAASSRRVADLFGAFAGTDLQSRDLQYALRMATISVAGLPARLQAIKAQRSRAEDLVDGTVNGVAPAAGALTQKHPDEALPLLKSAGTALDALISDITTEQQQLGAEKPWVKASPGLTAILEGSAERPGMVSVLEEARSERARLDVLTASVAQQADAATVASREGDNDFAQAQAALARRDPDGATSALELATAAYLRSLAAGYSQHAAARTTTDADDINAKILALQNALSVANAQKEVTAINKLVAARDYLGASDALDSALREWSQTQTGSYPPFDLLRQTIQAAMELSQGREISRLDPKADVVNAFIKNAQDNIAVGRLTVAMQNVKDALAVAPNYGAAKVLQLRIKKQTDPSGFERDAAAQIATYLKMGADSTNVEGQKTAYLALLDYSRLDPKFAAELRAPIQELEYSLGLVRRPPTPQQVARSSALVQQASLVQQPGTPQAFQSALDLLKQALQVNPDNTDAVRLDGLIRTRMGSTALAALTPADTQTYNQAFSMFLSGAYQDAYDKVLQLWNDPRSPRNKTYGPLQRLKRRLEVQLNIS